MINTLLMSMTLVVYRQLQLAAARGSAALLPW